jgi:hypothetical protein
MPVCVPMYTQSGEAHGLVNILTNSVESNDNKHFSPENKIKIEKEKKEDSKIVKVKYHNQKGNHERLDKPYCKYAGDPIQVYHLIPGYVYDLPLGMVKEIQEMKKVERSGLQERDGQTVTSGGAPLDKDRIIEGEHLLYPATF